MEKHREKRDHGDTREGDEKGSRRDNIGILERLTKIDGDLNGRC
jgi:hypothetical protein